MDHLPRIPLRPLLTALGALTTLTLTSRLLRHIYIYFIRPSTLSRYLRPRAWALITGASDGIGRGYARALASHNLNLILHGRNESKLSTVRDELLAKHPSIQIRLLIIDASTSHGLKQAIENGVKELSDLDGPLTILINNAGGTHPQSGPYVPLEGLSANEVDGMVNLNARFPMQLTRALMPQLIAAQPSLLLNICSSVSLQPPPWLPVYSAVKGFGEKWSVSMSRTLRAQGHDVEAMTFVVGKVTGTSHNKSITSLFEPGGDDFARDSLRRIGCGEEVIAPWWPHALQVAFMSALPTSLGRRSLGQVVGKLKEIEESGSKEE